MIAFLGSLFSVIPVLWEIWKKIEGTPQEKTKAMIGKVSDAFQKASDSRGDFSDLDHIS